MRSILFIIVVVFFSVQAKSQDNQITMKQTFFGTTFDVQGEDASKYNPTAPMKSILDILEEDEKSYSLFKKGRSQYIAGQVIGSVGGFIMGYQLGASLGGGEVNWTVFGVGAGITAISIPFSLSAIRNMDNAIEIYNKGGQITSRNSTETMLTFTGKGVGLRVSF